MTVGQLFIHTEWDCLGGTVIIIIHNGVGTIYFLDLLPRTRGDGKEMVSHDILLRFLLLCSLPFFFNFLLLHHLSRNGVPPVVLSGDANLGKIYGTIERPGLP